MKLSYIIIYILKITHSIQYLDQHIYFKNSVDNNCVHTIAANAATAVAAAPSLKSISALISWGAYASSLELYEAGSQKSALMIA